MSGAVGAGVGALSVVLLLPMVVRLIGMELYGTWATLAIFQGAANLGVLGMSRSLARNLPSCPSDGARRMCYSAALIPVAIVAAVAVASFAVIESTSKVAEVSDREWSVALLGAGLLVFCTALWNELLFGIWEGLFLQHHVNGLRSAQGLLVILGLLGMAYLRLPGDILLIGTAGIHTLLSAILTVRTHRRLHLLPVRVPWSYAKGVISYGIGSLSSGFLPMALVPINRYLLVSGTGDLAAYAVFDIAQRSALFGKRLSSAFCRPFLSVFSTYGHQGFDRIECVLHSWWVRMLPIVVLALVGFFVVGDGVLRFLYGSPDARLYRVTFYLLAGSGLAAVCEPYLLALLALGRLRLTFIARLLMPVAYLIVLVVLSDEEDLIRYAAAFSVAVGSNAIILMVAFQLYSAHYRQGLGCERQVP